MLVSDGSKKIFFATCTADYFICVVVTKCSKTCICILVRQVLFTNYNPIPESKLNFTNYYLLWASFISFYGRSITSSKASYLQSAI